MKKNSGKRERTEADLNMELSAKYLNGKVRQIKRKARNFSHEDYFDELDKAFNTTL